MYSVFDALIVLHIFAGFTALLTGGIALSATKGKKMHRLAGKIYSVAMLIIFITALFVATERDNRFLFLIAFLSFYSVFAGFRSLKLKKLHLGQSALWYDWAAGGINGVMNILFTGIGVYMLFNESNALPAALLYTGFGLAGLSITYTNLKPFLHRPQKAFHWYLSHIGNMTGSYIATFTAFLTTMGSRLDVSHNYIIVFFVLPSIIGIPILLWWQHNYTQRFTKSNN